jgi:hypothetical protein
MSTVWNGDTYAPAGHSDVEQMEINRQFNTPTYNLFDSSKTSTLEFSKEGQHEQKYEEDGIVARPTKMETVTEPIISSETVEPPPDGGLTAWLQGKPAALLLSVENSLT